MRTFRDSNDVEWTVFEVRRQLSSRGDLSYLPGGFSNGWLCFESPVAKRRLIKYPERWREASDEALEELLSEAAPAPRGSMRLGDDLTDGDSSIAT
jgi:hypothetical protein